MAELERSALRRQCLDRRLGDRATVAAEVAAWVKTRNAGGVAIDRRFTTADGRIELTRLSPAVRA